MSRKSTVDLQPCFSRSPATRLTASSAELGHLGDGGNPAVRLAKEEIEVARVHAAKADETKVDPLAWLVRRTGRDDVRQRPLLQRSIE